MKPDDFSRPAKLDEQIGEITNKLERRQQAQSGLADAPDLRLALDIRYAYQAEADEDQRSLERVLARLTGDDVADRPKVIFLPQANKPQKRMSTMQTNTMNSSPQPKDKGKSSWTKHVGLIAAVLCITLLVGGFLTVLNATHAGRTTGVGSHTTVTPTPQPTAPQVIQKAILTDSRAGNSEGVGPNLAGISSKTHFTVGQQFWIFFLAKAPNEGTATVKWYENNTLYKTSSQELISVPANSSGTTPAPTPSGNAPLPTPSGNSSATNILPVESNFSITYNQAGTGKVELYWNGQLELTLYFTVSSK
jgi:hypothetical protein